MEKPAFPSSGSLSSVEDFKVICFKRSEKPAQLGLLGLSLELLLIRVISSLVF